MATKKTNTPKKPTSKKTTAHPKAAKKTTTKAVKKTPVKKKTTRTKKAVQAAAVQTAVTTPVEEQREIRTQTESLRFESRNPLDYFLRLDVLIALSLFFLLVTTVISFTVLRQEVAELQTAVAQLEEIVYGR